MMTNSPLSDGISKVEIIDSLGTDLTVVNAARVSMAKESAEFTDKDAGLINYLATHGHWTPFSQPQVQLRIKMPIFIARQWFKHQVGFTRNEVSRRYVDDTPEFYVPTAWRMRAANVKQGSSDDLWDWQGGSISIGLRECVRDYHLLLENGVAPEMARMVLPQSMYTEFIETGSLAAYARLCKQRLDPHAQKEIQAYATVVSQIIEPLFPHSWKALTK